MDKLTQLVLVVLSSNLTFVLATTFAIDNLDTNRCDAVKSAYRSINGFSASDVPNFKIEGTTLRGIQEIVVTLKVV